MPSHVAPGWFRPTLWLVLFWLTPRVPGGELHSWDRFDSFHQSTNGTGGEVVWDGPVTRSRDGWNELIASWNVDAPEGTAVQVSARAFREQEPGGWFLLGSWSRGTNGGLRHSFGRQPTAEGEVATDVLRLHQPAGAFQLRLAMSRRAGLPWPEIRFLAVALDDTRRSAAPRPSNHQAWGRSLAVPQISQHAYDGGRSWCSPTCLAMVLGYWADRLHRPSLRLEVPAVAAGVFDPVWHGTGNWPFNTAFAGSLPGMRAYVTRLDDLSDLEPFILKGIPVVASVSLNRLRQRPAQPDDGHLVVVTGFERHGDVWVNDPDTTHPPVPGKSVRRLYSRQAFEAGWAASHRTVYLIQPEPYPRRR
jgi:uncharacterized protein YvpB